MDGLTQVVLSVAPHKALMDAFEAFNQEMFGEEGGTDSLLDLFSKTRIAEMASYAQIAYERVRAIRKLENVLEEGGAEDVLQRIVDEAPWLIDATWTPITANQSLKLFARKFAAYYNQQHGEEVTFSIDHHGKRPDRSVNPPCSPQPADLKMPGRRRKGTSPLGRHSTTTSVGLVSAKRASRLMQDGTGRCASQGGFHPLSPHQSAHSSSTLMKSLSARCRSRESDPTSLTGYRAYASA